jgi:hypothetical protein
VHHWVARVGAISLCTAAIFEAAAARVCHGEAVRTAGIRVSVVRGGREKKKVSCTPTQIKMCKQSKTRKRTQCLSMNHNSN